MNKEYMLEMINERIKIVEEKYRACFDITGPSKSEKGAAVNRSRCQKELRILKLLHYFVMRCPDTLSLPDDLTDAFDQVVEPRRLR